MDVSVRIPACSAAIDPEWLNRVLPASVCDGGTVTAVHAEVIGEGVGLMGEVARLTLTYEGAGPDAVTTMISKVPTMHDSFRMIGNAFGFYRKEHGFYRDAAHRVTMRIPQAYANLADHEHGVYALLLEDMAPRRPGNQLAGCSIAEGEAIVSELARHHAAWWEHPDLHAFGDWLPGAGDSYFELTRSLYLAALPKFVAGFGDWVSPDVMALAVRVGERYEESVQVGAFRRPHTFVHGDFRLDNMLFHPGADGMEVAVLDWQLPFRANPLWDVAYFIGGNFDTAARRAHERALLARYHAELVANGVRDYSFAVCEEDYRACGLILVSYLVNLGGDADLDELNDRGRELVELLCRRYGSAIDDLGSGSFLP